MCGDAGVGRPTVLLSYRMQNMLGCAADTLDKDSKQLYCVKCLLGYAFFGQCFGGYSFNFFESSLLHLWKEVPL